MFYVIKRPLITEKITIQNAAGVYVFEVDLKANKSQIKNAVEKLFSVKVKKVRTAIYLSEKKRVGSQASPGNKKFKKAFVQLQDSQKISIFEGV